MSIAQDIWLRLGIGRPGLRSVRGGRRIAAVGIVMLSVLAGAVMAADILLQASEPIISAPLRWD